MNVCILGAGAIGSLLAAALARGGLAPTVVARGANLRNLTTKGLRVRTQEWDYDGPVSATDDISSIAKQDTIFVTVKTTSLGEIGKFLHAPLVGPNTSIVFVSNGIPWWYYCNVFDEADRPAIFGGDVNSNLSGLLSTASVVGSVIYSASEIGSSGVVEVKTPENTLVVGRVDGSQSTHLDPVAAIMRRGGVEFAVADDIRRLVWEKLVLTLGSGPMSILAGATVSELFARDGCAGAMAGIASEVFLIAAAAGYPLSGDPMSHIDVCRDVHHKVSLLQDIDRGRPPEIDSMLLAPLNIARHHNIATPLLDMAVSLVLAKLNRSDRQVAM